MRLAGLFLLLLVLLPQPADADCSGGAKSALESCGKIGFVGCCDGEVLNFCEGGGLCTLSCESLLHCGFNSEKGYYDCGTDGLSDPKGMSPKECPTDPCQGVGFGGCCSGTKVFWCNDKTLQSIDCSGNDSFTSCGMNTGSGIADCLPSDSPKAAACPFQGPLDDPDGGSVESDGISSPDAGSTTLDEWAKPEVSVSLDGILVPDLDAPKECKSAAGYYEVNSSDCGIFAAAFGVKQEGCVVVLAGLVPTADSHPAGKATLSGLAFDFFDAGKKRQCMGQFVGDTVQGQCYWGQEQCSFSFAPIPDPDSEGNEETDGGNSSGAVKAGGCTSARYDRAQEADGLVWSAFLFLAAWIGLRRRGRQHKTPSI